MQSTTGTKLIKANETETTEILNKYYTIHSKKEKFDRLFL